MKMGIGNLIAHLKRNAPNEWTKTWISELSKEWLRENKDIRGIRDFENMTIDDDDGTFRLYVNGTLFAMLDNFEMSIQSSAEGTHTRITFERSGFTPKDEE